MGYATSGRMLEHQTSARGCIGSWCLRRPRGYLMTRARPRTVRAFLRHEMLKQNLSPVKVLVNIVLPAVSYPAIRTWSLSTMLNALRSVFGQPFTWRMGARWLMNAWAWLRSLLLWGLMGYGERPLRVLGLAAFVILGYAAIYHAAGAIRESTFRAALYFSMITFTTVGYGDIPPRPEFRLLAASEALVGVVLCGLFLFCIGRRSVGRA